jgi:hypothetical protein
MSLSSAPISVRLPTHDGPLMGLFADSTPMGAPIACTVPSNHGHMLFACRYSRRLVPLVHAGEGPRSGPNGRTQHNPADLSLPRLVNPANPVWFACVNVLMRNENLARQALR